MIEFLSNKLKLDPDLMRVIIACGCNRLDIIKKNYKLISDKLKIDNIDAVESIIKICSGDISQVWEFKNKTNDNFNIENPYLMYCIMYLITQGKKITQGRHKYRSVDCSFA